MPVPSPAPPYHGVAPKIKYLSLNKGYTSLVCARQS